jgi:hypothetical protein
MIQGDSLQPTNANWPIDLEPLVRMKLASYRLNDRIHLLDMIDVGLIDATWPGRFPAELASRLRAMLENPDA